MKYLVENCGELDKVGTDVYNITPGYTFVSLSCLYYFENTVERIKQRILTLLYGCADSFCAFQPT